MMCGGKTDEKSATQEVQDILNALKDEIKAKVGEFKELVATKFSTQCVRGTNYFIKAHLGDNKYAHFRIHQDLPCNESKLSLHGVQTDKSEHDPIAYF